MEYHCKRTLGGKGLVETEKIREGRGKGYGGVWWCKGLVETWEIPVV